MRPSSPNAGRNLIGLGFDLGVPLSSKPRVWSRPRIGQTRPGPRGLRAIVRCDSSAPSLNKMPRPSGGQRDRDHRMSSFGARGPDRGISARPRPGTMRRTVRAVLPRLAREHRQIFKLACWRQGILSNGAGGKKSKARSARLIAGRAARVVVKRTTEISRSTVPQPCGPARPASCASQPSGCAIGSRTSAEHRNHFATDGLGASISPPG